MKYWSARLTIAAVSFLAPFFALTGCALLPDFGRTADSHIVDDNGSGFDVTMAADRTELRVALDTEHTLEKRMVWAATFGVNQGPAPAEFETIASKWLSYEHPECKIGAGRRLSLTSYEYGVSCSSDSAKH